MSDEVGDAMREGIGLADPAPAMTSRGRVSAALSPVPCVAHRASCALSSANGSAGDGVAGDTAFQVRPLYINTVDNILIGSASWTDKTLIACGRFYPKECKSAEARLRYYAEQFPIVEVDSSYYGIPVAIECAVMGRSHARKLRVQCQSFPALHRPPDLAHRLAQGHTAGAGAGHPPGPLLQGRTGGDPRRVVAPLQRGTGALAPARQARRRAFPVRAVDAAQSEGHAHVEECVTRMEGFLVAVEFRNKSWFDGANAAKTLAFERELGVVHTIVDGPQGFANSVPDVWEVTHPDLALVRLHGRNYETWNHKGRRLLQPLQLLVLRRRAGRAQARDSRYRPQGTQSPCAFQHEL